MISFDEALKRLDSVAFPAPKTESVPLARSLGRILAEEVRADQDMPPFDKSTMDGYAVRREDASGPVRHVFTIPAGVAPKRALARGECAKVMTGACVPSGADCVVPVELVIPSSDEKNDIVSFSKIPKDAYIEKRGSQYKKKDFLLASGTRLCVQETAVLAAAGKARLRVYRKPRVGVLATGDELVDVGKKPGPFQIRNSNSSQLLSQLHEAGCEAKDYGIASDDPKKIETLLRRALKTDEVVFLSGGVSAGDFDFVPGIIQKIGANIIFDRVAVKPGKPTLFATKGRKMIFGLPGNPVSSFVIFSLLAKPLLARMSGGAHEIKTLHAPLAEAVAGIPHERLSFRPVFLGGDGLVRLPRYQGSAHIHAYVSANAMLRQEAHSPDLKTGDAAKIILL